MNMIIFIAILILIAICSIFIYLQRHEIRIDVTEYKDPVTGKDYRDLGHLIVYVDSTDVSPALIPDDTAIIKLNIKIGDLNSGDIVYTNLKKFYRISRIDLEKNTVDLMNSKNSILKDQPISYIIGKLIGKAQL